MGRSTMLILPGPLSRIDGLFIAFDESEACVGEDVLPLVMLDVVFVAAIVEV